MIRFAFVIVILSCACLNALSLEASRILAEFPFIWRNGLVTFEARIEGLSTPGVLVLDSGAQVSVVNLSTAKRIHARLGKAVRVDGVDSTVKGYWPTKGVSITAGEVVVPSELLAMNLDQLDTSCGVRVDGLLGADFLAGHILRIDFSNQKLQLLADIPEHDNTETVKLDSAPNSIRIPLRINGGREELFRLDTGCASPLQWVAGMTRAQVSSSQVIVALAPVSVPSIETSVQLGSISLNSVATGLHSKTLFPGESGLLGCGLLRTFSAVTMDCKGQRLILESSCR